WFAMLFVWGIIFLVLLLLLAVCSYAAIALISVVKIRQIEQSEDHLFLALREAFLHVKPVVGAVLLVQFLANLLIILFSIPVIWIGVDDLNLVQSSMLLFF